ncbi:MAG TPA: SurA N-terminal domain-containing protein [Rhizomicrobium sp.]|jgi:peptidyl-prolyl cis-trans isomerase D
MLQQMRKFSNSWAVKILFVALILSFALWGIGDVIRGATSDTSVASVGGTKIPYEIYTRDYTNMKRNLSARAGTQITPEQAQKMGLPTRALDALLNQTALDMVTDRLGLAVGDGQVNATVHSMGFTGPLGTFDHDTFLKTITSSGFTEPGFIEAMRNDIERQQVLSAARNGFVAPMGLVRAFYAYARETRAAQYVIVPASAADAVPAPTDAQLTAYVKAHADQFSVPAFRAITYAQVSPDDVAGQFKITDGQIQQVYDQRKNDPQYGYYIPEKRDVQQLNFKDQASVTAARAKIDGGMKFDDLARSLGTAPISLGSVTEEQMGDRGKAIFAAPMDGVSAPVKNLAGFALFHVSKITPGGGKQLAEVKDSIRKELLDEQAGAKLEDIGNAYMEANSGGLSITQSGQKVGMHVVHVPAVDATGHAPDGSKANVPQDPEFLAQMMLQEPATDGDPFSGKDAHKYVINVESETPSRLKPLSAVRDQATAMWTAEARRKALAVKAQQLAAQASGKGDLSSLAASLHVPVQNSAALDRGKGNGDLTADLVTRLFAVPGGSVVAGPAAKGDGYIVARVSGVSHVPLSPGDPVFAQFQGQVNANTADSIATGIAAGERAKQGVTINQKQLDLANGNGNDNGS